MNERGQDEMEAMELEVVRALERRPRVEVPAGFAARVVQSLPVKGQARVRRPASVGRQATLVAAAVLTGAMFVLAPHAGPSLFNWAFDAELIALTELAGVAWLLTRLQGARW